MGATGISMYLYLLKIGYENNRYDFQLSDVLASKGLGLTRKTIKSTKERLRNFGLIEFQTRNGLPCHYRLLLDYPLQIVERVKKEKMESDKSSVTYQFENEKIASRLQSCMTVVFNKNIPSFEEFIEYAQSLKIYTIDLEFGIREKYETWVDNG